MRVTAYKIEVESQMILSQRELQLLHHICSYENKTFAKNVASSYYHGGVSAKEIEQFMDHIREVTGRLMTGINEVAKGELFKHR